MLVQVDNADRVAVTSVAVVGAGLMGTGIATALLNADLAVTLIETRSDALDAAVKRIRAAFARDIEKGRLPARTAEHRMNCLTPSDTINAAADADLVIEAVFEGFAAGANGWSWTPAPLLIDLVARNATFGSLAR